MTTMQKTLVALTLSTCLANTYGATAKADDLAGLRARLEQVLAQVNACIAQYNDAASRSALGAMNGIVVPPPPCLDYMPQWTAQAAWLETQIYRGQTGDHQTPLSCIVGIPIPGISCR
jgi:hypothetical protein